MSDFFVLGPSWQNHVGFLKNRRKTHDFEYALSAKEKLLENEIIIPYGLESYARLRAF
jgi:hypothetical protein